MRTSFVNSWNSFYKLLSFGVPTICKGGPNDIFALKDKEKYVLRI